jgi:hypothetical protein
MMAAETSTKEACKAGAGSAVRAPCGLRTALAWQKNFPKFFLKISSGQVSHGLEEDLRNTDSSKGPGELRTTSIRFLGERVDRLQTASH